MTRSEYILAETRLVEDNEKLTIYHAAIERDIDFIKDTFGGSSSISKALGWVTEQGKKWMPIFSALLDFMRDMRPLVIKGEEVILPSKWNPVKWLKIGWAAGKLIVKIINIILKK